MFVVTFLRCQAADQQYRVNLLPGWEDSLPSAQYSGYIQTNNDDYNMFFWLVEAQEVNAST